MLCQPSALGSHLEECPIYPFDVVTRHLLGFEPYRGREVLGAFPVLKLEGLDLRRVETAIGDATQPMFAEKAVNDLDIGSGW